MQKRISKKRFGTITPNDARILSLVIARLELSNQSEILEAFLGASPALSGFFDAYGARVTTLAKSDAANVGERVTVLREKLTSLRGGEFDVVFVYNLASRENIGEIIDAAKRHVHDEGKVVILNTLNVICVDSLCLSHPVVSADNCDVYSLIIL